MVNTTEEINLTKIYMRDQEVDPGLCYPHDDWLRGLGKHQDQNYRDLMQQIANWANFYLDDIIEILVCLLIFFKQDQGTSNNIDQIGTMWRWKWTNNYKILSKDLFYSSALYRYIESLTFEENTKREVYNEAINIVNMIGRLA